MFVVATLISMLTLVYVNTLVTGHDIATATLTSEAIVNLRTRSILWTFIIAAIHSLNTIIDWNAPVIDVDESSFAETLVRTHRVQTACVLVTSHTIIDVFDALTEPVTSVSRLARAFKRSIGVGAVGMFVTNFSETHFQRQCTLVIVKT